MRSQVPHLLLGGRWIVLTDVRPRHTLQVGRHGYRSFPKFLSSTLFSDLPTTIFIFNFIHFSFLLFCTLPGSMTVRFVFDFIGLEMKTFQSVNFPLRTLWTGRAAGQMAHAGLWKSRELRGVLFSAVTIETHSINFQLQLYENQGRTCSNL